jgi:hypothetical protein
LAMVSALLFGDQELSKQSAPEIIFRAGPLKDLAMETLSLNLMKKTW